MQSRKLYKSLYFQVIVAIICGVLLGHFMPDSGTAMKPLGDGFIKLVKMMITPIIFCTVVVGIAGMEDMKKVGRVGGKALLYFEVVTTLALIIGLVVVNVLKPGAGMNVDPATLDTGAIAKFTAKAGEQSVVDFVLHIIPNSVVGAFAEGEILQVLLFSVLFGFALSMMGQSGKPVVKLVEDISHALFAAIGTKYGAGDGSSTFNLPNIPDGHALLAANGSVVGGLASGEVKSHSHTASGTADAQGDHQHKIWYCGGSGPITGFGGPATGGSFNSWSDHAGIHSHAISLTINAAGTPSNLAAGIKLLVCIAYE